MPVGATEYPATLRIEYPEGERNRVTAFFRPVLAVPICIALGLITGPSIHAGSREFAFESGGIIFLATALMLLFRRRYPLWWFAWNLELTRFTVRVSAYLCLLRDEYPSTEDPQGVDLGQSRRGSITSRVAPRRRTYFTMIRPVIWGWIEQ